MGYRFYVIPLKRVISFKEMKLFSKKLGSLESFAVESREYLEKKSGSVLVTINLLHPVCVQMYL